MNKLSEIRQIFFGVAEYIDMLRSENGRADVSTLIFKSVEIINQFKLDLVQLGAFISKESADKLTYSVCALLDEQTISRLSEDERELWLASPLQIRYYFNNNSGDQICDEIEKICFDKEEKDEFLALGYALVLKLGYMGAFSSNNNRYLNVLLSIKNRYPELYNSTNDYFPSVNLKLKVWKFVEIRRILLFFMIIFLCVLYVYWAQNI